MEGSASDAGRAAPSQPLRTTLSPRRNNMQASPGDQGDASSPSEAPLSPVSPRSIGSRRRRMRFWMGRLGPDQRNLSSSTFDPEAPEFIPESAVRAPSKRKASSSATPGLSSQTASIFGPVTARHSELPMIRADDVLLGPPSTPSTPSNTETAHVVSLRELLDSSDDDPDMPDLSSLETRTPFAARTDVRIPRTPVQPRIDFPGSQGHRSPHPSGGPKWRQEPSPKLSAILVCNDQASQDCDVSRMLYLPLRPVPRASGYRDDINSEFLTVLPGHRDLLQRSQVFQGPNNLTWPLDELPVELFDLITSHLARDDVKSMRMVNREFERKVSRSLFHTSVVPFNTEIYDMIDDHRRTMNRATRPVNKGKGKAKDALDVGAESAPSSDAVGLHWQNATEDKEGKVYKGHGLRVFQGFGPHMKRFGMSFEISEKQLRNPPSKKKLEHVESYHGSYVWPSEHYPRFASLAGLENTADETSRMKAAFTNLHIVQELALSVDSGLGWLTGPDKSVRAHIFERPFTVFGNSYKIPDHATQAASKFWTDLQQSQLSFEPHSSLKEINMEYRTLQSTPKQLDGLRDTIYSESQLWSSIDQNKVVPTLSSSMSKIDQFGVLYTTSGQGGSQRKPFSPVNLSRDQQEWLLETQWAQQAFLESYMLAIIDNPENFHNVSKLNIAKLSSCFLPILTREPFWDALPNLSDVTLHVSADWRTVEKSDIGIAQTTNKLPAHAVDIFYRDVLQRRVAMRRSIKTLDIGWVGGGEHAEGMFARNNHILPAPIVTVGGSTTNSSSCHMIFEHVEHLILSNCWITPPRLEGLIRMHSNMALKKLTLDSVSLTAHPKFPLHNQAGVAHAQAPPHLAQALAATQAQFANHAQAVQAQLAQNAQAVAQGLGGGMHHPQFVPPGGLPAGPWMFMPQPNAPQMAAWQQQPQPPGPHAAQQLLQQHYHMLQNQMQLHGPAGQLAMNAQIHQQPQPHPAAPIPAPAPANIPVANNVNVGSGSYSHWSAGHREGSWPQVLDSISPGPVFDDYLPAPAPWEEPLPPRPETNLRTIELKSCGYVKLSSQLPFDQTMMELAPDMGRHDLSSWFRSRWYKVKSAMMTTNDRHLGQIVQYMPQRELMALQFAWGLTEGWEDTWKAEEAEFDGLQPGGTGRVSGILQNGMDLIGLPAGSNGGAV